MKASEELYSEVETAIQNILVRFKHTLAGAWDEYQQKGKTHVRFRWDLFWLASDFSKGELYKKCAAEGLTDDHIDTMLRKITHAGDVT